MRILKIITKNERTTKDLFTFLIHTTIIRQAYNSVSNKALLDSCFAYIHHLEWKYQSNNMNSELLTSWAEDHNLHLVFDAKDQGTFKSAALQREYNPEPRFVSKDKNNLHLATSRKVPPDFAHS